MQQPNQSEREHQVGQAAKPETKRDEDLLEVQLSLASEDAQYLQAQRRGQLEHGGEEETEDG